MTLAGAAGAVTYHPGIGSDPSSPERSTRAPWTFLSSHGIVLLVIARDTAIRLREIAERVGITERAVQRIVADLIAAGYLSRVRIGRRNFYEVHGEVHMRHPTTRHMQVGDLMDLLRSPPPPTP